MIKEMEYKPTNENYTYKKVLYNGMYKGVKVVIMSYGTHPCAYLFFKKGHYMYGMSQDDADEVVCVHGGFTYNSDKRKGGVDDAVEKGEYDYGLGWDYAHSDDKQGSFWEGKAWTTQEILEECRQAVDTIIYNTPVVNPVWLNPLVDFKESELKKTGRPIYKIVSQDPKRDFTCKFRFFGKFKDVTKETLDRLANVPVYATKCKYCGSQFITNSRIAEICCESCKRKNQNEVTKRFMQKYMKMTRQKLGYSIPYYVKNRSKILEKRKLTKLQDAGKSKTFVCDNCGKVFDYIKDNYHLRSKNCRECRKKLYPKIYGLDK